VLLGWSESIAVCIFGKLGLPGQGWISSDCDAQTTSYILKLGGVGAGGGSCHCFCPWEVISADGSIVRGEAVLGQVVGGVVSLLLSSSDSCWHH